jgi:hypothetical protein
LDLWVANAHECREDREARGRLAAEAAGEAYIAELHRRYPEQVEAEHRPYAEYAAGRTEVIDVSLDEEGDVDGGSGGNSGGNVSFYCTTSIYDSGRIFDDPEDGTGPDPMIGGLSRAEWKSIATEDSDGDQN